MTLAPKLYPVNGVQVNDVQVNDVQVNGVQVNDVQVNDVQVNQFFDINRLTLNHCATDLENTVRKCARSRCVERQGFA